MSASDHVPDAVALQRAIQDLAAYSLDTWQRSVLTADVLRERGNVFLEHLLAGKPPLLTFEHELVLDGRTLPRPCNYSLLRIVPTAGMPVDAAKRPIVIVDPRAGHGPGIGGFKPDSEVGVALRAGHTVYFVTFSPEPEEGQTLVDVARAEAAFLEEVVHRHPECPQKPAVIGNCQAGWAMAALASVRGDVMGPLVLNGAPLSYWSGSAKQNPMRYAGGLLGGAWLSAFTADISGDRFDGAWLVNNFENLNLGNTYWGKLYNLYASVDTERERFLEFERWWGGYFRMTGEEIESIVENLFVGNRLARGEVEADGVKVDLRNITSPVVVFASWGDNITPPQQALDWILDVWGSEKALVAAGRTIVYMLHPTIGHLGIFVGGAVARKEHDQVVNTLDQIEALPPGLFEMKIETSDPNAAFAALETGGYSVRFEMRSFDDIRALDPDGRGDEAMFSTIAQLSEMNMQAYRTFAQPFVRAMGSRALGDFLRWAHPLRQQHLALSDMSPFAPWLRQAAEQAREHREPVASDNVWLAWERLGSEWITKALDKLGTARDDASEKWLTLAYGPRGLGALLPPAVADELAALHRAGTDEAKARRMALANVDKGGFAEAVCRIVLAGITRGGGIERRNLRIAQLLGSSHREMVRQMVGVPASAEPLDWPKIFDAQALIVTFAPQEAMGALPKLLPTQAEREHALALGAAVLMAEPTLSDPNSPAAHFIRERLGVDPARIAALSLSLAQTVASDQALGSSAPVPGVSTDAPAKEPRRQTRTTAKSTGKTTVNATAKATAKSAPEAAPRTAPESAPKKAAKTAARKTAKAAPKTTAKAAAGRGKAEPAAKPSQRELRLVVNRPATGKGATASRKRSS
ncbi:DUF3141 domain-containing protein [Variovorax sp. OV329]|uniref:DUF3141 domain-containing protein n=1 Tax=Variovorax sp. OV329 TaxID=1882825 RepID=UPI0008EB5A0A|nr:DUF3141 domain-containing protein [Variovorax sp. OV329]SFN19732.1 Protein of unknown function [Variovorax sp. OV329]